MASYVHSPVRYSQRIIRISLVLFVLTSTPFIHFKLIFTTYFTCLNVFDWSLNRPKRTTRLPHFTCEVILHRVVQIICALQLTSTQNHVSNIDYVTWLLNWTESRTNTRWSCVMFLMQEVIQNAEDAGATRIVFLIDHSTYGSDQNLLYDKRLAKFQVCLYWPEELQVNHLFSCSVIKWHEQLKHLIGEIRWTWWLTVFNGAGSQCLYESWTKQRQRFWHALSITAPQQFCERDDGCWYLTIPWSAVVRSIQRFPSKVLCWHFSSRCVAFTLIWEPIADPLSHICLVPTMLMLCP